MEIKPDENEDTCDDDEMNWEMIESCRFYFTDDASQAFYLENLSIVLCNYFMIGFTFCRARKNSLHFCGL